MTKQEIKKIINNENVKFIKLIFVDTWGCLQSH